jgi:hypothetical protein
MPGSKQPKKHTQIKGAADPGKSKLARKLATSLRQRDESASSGPDEEEVRHESAYKPLTSDTTLVARSKCRPALIGCQIPE